MEGAGLPPSILEEFITEDEHVEDYDDLEDVFRSSISLLEERLHNTWYHPSPKLFYDLMLKLVKEDDVEEDNQDLLLIERCNDKASRIAAEAISRCN